MTEWRVAVSSGHQNALGGLPRENDDYLLDDFVELLRFQIADSPQDHSLVGGKQPVESDIAGAVQRTLPEVAGIQRDTVAITSTTGSDLAKDAIVTW